ncbi:aldose 1-epimerase family protein [Pleomorphomonas koreensis]|uniref:aldose 1-epimerase family protein n=1 Tax=Pleomorphomonas koreensis TaxID=257440 RepID=UPI0003FC17C9|nr:aldose 1-epimerase family protein [Pleomorphomonas koreensis]
MQDDFIFTLTDTAGGIELADWAVTSTELGLDDGTPFEIVKRTLHGGRQEGSTLVTIRAGRLTVTVIPTRGMGILRASLDGVGFGWASPVDEVVHPSFIRLGERNGLGWLEGFNELMVRCGYEWSGHPTVDGDKVYTLHGRAGNTPASKVEVCIGRQAPHRIVLRGLVKEKAFKNVDFETWTELTVVPGDSGFSLDDRLTNRADYAHPYEVIYHTNVGRPVLDEGARVVGPFLHVAPFNDAAKPDLATWDRYRGPTPDFDEMLYACELKAGADGKTEVALVNASSTLGFSVTYHVAELPAFSLWKNTDTDRQGYVTGLEPGSNYPYPLPVERAAGRLKTLEPGAEARFRLRFDLLSDKTAVDACVARIGKLGTTAGARVHAEPIYRTESRA